MPKINRQAGKAINRLGGRELSPSLERAICNEIDIVQGHGLVQAARAGAVEYVAFTSLRAVEGLTDMEALALQRNPLGDARYKAIVDTATGALARLVAETGQA